MAQSQQRLMVMVRKEASVAIRTRADTYFFKTLNGGSEILRVVTDQLIKGCTVQHDTTRVVPLGWINCPLQSMPYKGVYATDPRH
jgi:hypothetical protein